MAGLRGTRAFRATILPGDRLARARLQHVALAWVHRAAPETRGRTLEEIEQHFRAA